jgi:hypothetical protein
MNTNRTFIDTNRTLIDTNRILIDTGLSIDISSLYIYNIVLEYFRHRKERLGGVSADHRNREIVSFRLCVRVNPSESM